jgi:hypothetical protein
MQNTRVKAQVIKKLCDLSLSEWPDTLRRLWNSLQFIKYAVRKNVVSWFINQRNSCRPCQLLLPAVEQKKAMVLLVQRDEEG